MYTKKNNTPWEGNQIVNRLLLFIMDVLACMLWTGGPVKELFLGGKACLGWIENVHKRIENVGRSSMMKGKLQIKAESRQYENKSS